MMQDYERVHGEVVQRLAPECAVLLKRDGSFPLKEPCKLALYGPGARHTVKGGTGSGEVNSRTSVSIEEGLKQAGFEITTKPWLDAWDETLRNADMAFVKEIRARARKHRTLALVEGMGAVMPMPEYSFRWEGEGYAALYVVSRNSGEGADRRPVKGDILLTDSEIRDILWMNHRYAKFMLVLNVGGPVDLSPVKDVRNILLLSQLGVPSASVCMNVGSSAAGYGFEYLSSTLDRVKAAALAQNDAQLQMPIVTPVSPETWGVKESMSPEEESPEWGPLDERGIEMEVCTASACLVGGSDMVIMKHPAAVATISKFIDSLM